MTRPLASLLTQLATPSLPAVDLTLDRMHALLAALGHPERRLPPTIHIAGTNGKGSLVAYLDSILRAGGYRVHAYTSPHLVRFNERIRLNGADVSDDTLLPALQRVAEQLPTHPATFFEATTAAAFLLFAEHPADLLILETGLGGRLDATNVATPILTAITPIAMDHEEYLGHTLAAIAGEKAGIMKPDTPCVTAYQAPEALRVLQAAAAALRAPLIPCGPPVTFPLPLPGPHQRQNAAMALSCLDALQKLGYTIPPNAVADGFRRTRHPARLQRLHGIAPNDWELWLDGGHNPSAGEALAVMADTEWRDKPLHLVCGMMQDKNAVAFLRPLAPFTTSCHTVAVEGEVRSHSAETLAAIARQAGMEAHPASSVAQALTTLTQIHPASGRILICGSLYLAGKVLAEFPSSTLE